MLTIRAPSPRVIIGYKARDAGAVLRTLAAVKVRTADALVTVWQAIGALSATASPSSVNGATAQPVDAPVFAGSVTVTPVGGAAPYTYLWARTDVNPGTWTLENGTTNTASFTADIVAAGSPQTATFRCTVTDGMGGTAMSPTITARARNVGGLS